MGTKASSLRNFTDDEIDELVPNFKILLVGRCGVGKSCIFDRLLQNNYTPERKSSDTTVHIGVKLIKLEKQSRAAIELWDIPHRLEMHQSIVEEYVKDTSAIIFIYSIQDRDSLQDLQAYYKALLKYYPGLYANMLAIPSFVLGNKCDLLAASISNEVQSQAKQWAASRELLHYDVSAQENTGLNHALRQILHTLLDHREIQASCSSATKSTCN